MQCDFRHNFSSMSTSLVSFIQLMTELKHKSSLQKFQAPVGLAFKLNDRYEHSKTWLLTAYTAYRR